MRLSRSRAWALLGAGLVATIVIDHVTGPQVNVVILYLGLACFGSWCLGERVGLGIGAVSVVMLGHINGFGAPGQVAAIKPVALAWNMIGRSLSMTVMVALASGLRHSLDHARWSATTDPLTGVLNKAGFNRRLRALISHAQRRQESVVLAYVDLDGFKGVNDGFGHAAGDTLLCDFAEKGADAIRAHDLFARIGGDEFVTLMTVPNCGQGDVAAEALHYRLSRILRDTGYAVTCSMGAMVVEANKIASTNRLIEAADGLMYEVKKSGKNALRVARLDLQPTITELPARPMPDRRLATQEGMADAA
ncbi:GGDEF domain-containing protein [Sphingomonas sp. CGMCC 1.13654]|uniref:diguanylate cyclase n=1 Tax=Sphingomonas chungangi TaxID=2683589 RepID=A0A838LBR5_9SPHN|nr:GGDEF domain-containing protein [Sphingomonas chungangi]MBA2936155.1 GGDEF domain-containing protein [Sphingomonas chungangi]MVW55541.1 diguanylate cyclase [Sphingomonas chungangi]